MRRNDLKGAEPYLAKAGDTPEAVYARGIHAALTKEYDTAETLLKEALEKGMKQAEDALRQIEEIKKVIKENEE